MCVGRPSTASLESLFGPGGVFAQLALAAPLALVSGTMDVMKKDVKFVIELLAEIIGVVVDSRSSTGDAGNVNEPVGELGRLFFKLCCTYSISEDSNTRDLPGVGCCTCGFKGVIFWSDESVENTGLAVPAGGSNGLFRALLAALPFSRSVLELPLRDVKAMLDKY